MALQLPIGHVAVATNMHTSGSTGKPKCVCDTEKGLLNHLVWMKEIYPFSQAKVLIFKTSINFVDHLQKFLVLSFLVLQLLFPLLMC